MNQLTLRKMAVAFLVGVGSYAIPRVLDALSAINATGNFNWSRSVAISFLAGVVAAGLRAALIYLPLNMVPSDANHGNGGASQPSSSKGA